MKKKTKWRFPKHTGYCPHRGCKMPFGNASETIQHYTKTHLLTAIWCSICHTTVGAGYYGEHFKRIHPDKPLPPDWRNIMVKCHF